MARMTCTTLSVWLCLALPFLSSGLQADTAATDGLVNFESPHVHPLELTPDKTRLLMVNTAAHVLEVYDVTGSEPELLRKVSVGLDPVSVRARSNAEAWVVNHISDSVSVVDLVNMRVLKTLETGNEPADVIFAGAPERAFVSISEANRIEVFDPANLSTPATSLAISGEDPRGLAVSPDGNTVYAAIFESGNATTAVSGDGSVNAEDVVSRPEGPYAGVSPPPNSGNDFVPALAAGLPPAPATALIVRKAVDNRWLDDNNGDWSVFINGPLSSLTNRVAGWDMPDNDVAIIDANSLAVSYQTRLMNIVMALAVNPATGVVTAVGTEAHNEVRFEPNLNGVFLRVNSASFGSGQNAVVSDLNPHLDYSAPTTTANLRTQSIGDPRGIAWSADGQRAFITGMGSNNVIVTNAAGARLGRLQVGEGPTGIVLDDQRGIGYVLNKFAGSLSVIDLSTQTQLTQVSFDDPTPQVIKAGRPFLYNTHLSSGLGHVSCASCHVDARTDRLSWDLGDPSGALATVLRANNSTGNTVGTTTVHPMKGPMLTQSLQDIMGFSTLHWRGDRADLAAFNGAFVSLMGAPAQLSPEDMEKFADFLGTIHLPPNPYRNVDNSRPTSITLPSGFVATTTTSFAALRGGNSRNNNCMRCHMNGEQRNDASNPELAQAFVAPAWAPLYDRLGFWPSLQSGSTAGFGFFHDGADDIHGAARTNTAERQSSMLAELLTLEGPGGPLTGAERRQDAHAGVGAQLTLLGTSSAAENTRLNQLMAIALGSPHAELIALSNSATSRRGYLLTADSVFQSNAAQEQTTLANLQTLAESGISVTFTLVANGMGPRLALDRDGNGVFDGDEDFDGDGLTDPVDPDDDNDGVPDVEDAFPLDATESLDSDADGVGDNADAFPFDPEEVADSDGDGVGDNADAFPNDPTETMDSDGDGIGDNADPDSTTGTPVVAPVPDQLSAVGAVVSVQISATDPADESLTYSASGLPAGLSLDPATGLISGITSTTQVTTVALQVTNDTGLFTSLSFVWQVSTNVALGGTASQSSVLVDFLDADNAHDGNTSGEFNDGSLIHTDLDSQPYWQIDLGARHQLSRVEVFNREDCCADALQNFHLLISDVPFAAGSLQGAQAQAGVTDLFQPGIAPRQTTIAVDRSGRFLRVQLEGADYLQLAEVEIYGEPIGGGSENLAPVVTNPGNLTTQVNTAVSESLIASDPENDALGYTALGLPTGLTLDSQTGLFSGTATAPGLFAVSVQVTDATNTTTINFSWQITSDAVATNVALGGIAQQSSTLDVGVDLGAAKAIDGNTNGNFEAGSITHTDFNAQPWWSVDLGAQYQISTVTLYNREDCCTESLSNLYVFLSGTPFSPTADTSELAADPAVTSEFVVGAVGRSREVAIFGSARYVRVQLTNSDYLQLAEVAVLGVPDDAVGTNRPPTLVNPGDLTTALGTDVAILLQASDPDGDALTYASTNLPPGVELEASTGALSGTPDTAGVYATTLSVRDGAITTSVNFVWRVVDGQALTNVALGGIATQSSTFANFSFLAADRAIDGNADGNFSGGSITHTELNQQPWWQVDLGAVYDLSTIRVFNREDCCEESLANVHVLLSDQPFVSTELAATLAQAEVGAVFIAGELGRETSIGVARSARYVRIQLAGTDYLQLAEVEIVGSPQ